MASVEKRIRDGSTTWLARWRDPDGKQRKRSFPRRTDADRFLKGVEADKLRGTYVDPTAGRVTVGEWAEKWLDAQVQLKPSTRARYAGLLRVQVLPTWQRVPLAAVSHADVVMWVQRLAASGLAPSTVRQAHRVLSLILDLALRDGRISRNAAEKVRLPRTTRPDPRFLTLDEVERLAGACPPPHDLFVLFLAFTGLRFGESAALRVRRLDLLRRRVHVAESVTEIHGRAVFSTPKTHQARSVPFPASLVDDLAALIAGRGADDFVFAAPGGGVLRNTNWRSRVLDPAAARADLVGITPHDLRHTAASLAISAGANVKAVQRMLGHASAAMTLDVYAGLFSDDLDDVASRMDAARAPRVPQPCPARDVVDLPARRTAS